MTASTATSKKTPPTTADVQVVWHIFPAYRQVQIHTGARLEHSTVFEGDQLCSAAPALPAFEMPVREVFRHPGKE